MTDNDKPNGDESRENKNGGSHNPVGIRKRTLVVSILVISVIVCSLVTASIFSSSILTISSTDANPVFSNVLSSGGSPFILSQNVHAQSPEPICVLPNGPFCRSLFDQYNNFVDKFNEKKRELDKKKAELQAKENEKKVIDARVARLENQRSQNQVQLDAERAQYNLSCTARSTDPVCVETAKTIEVLEKRINEINAQLKPAIREQKRLEKQIDALKKEIPKLDNEGIRLFNKAQKVLEDYKNNNCNVGASGVQARGLSQSNQIQANSIEETTAAATAVSCGNVCVDLSSTDSCGTSCNDIKQCQAPTGGTATCSNGQCGGICPSGQEEFNGQCLDKCPAGATRVPPFGECYCGLGVLMCDDQCIPQSDNGNCGSCGNACPGGTQCDIETTGGPFCNKCSTGTAPRFCIGNGNVWTEFCLGIREPCPDPSTF